MVKLKTEFSILLNIFMNSHEMSLKNNCTSLVNLKQNRTVRIYSANIITQYFVDVSIRRTGK